MYKIEISGISTKAKLAIMIALSALLLQSCPQQMVKMLEKQEKQMEEYKNRKPVYLTQSRTLASGEELESTYFNDSNANYDSLIKAESFPIRFEITKIESENFPNQISLRTVVFDTNGRYISGLAPPYYTGDDSYLKYWKLLTDSCLINQNMINNFEVKEIRDNQKKPYSIAFILDHSGSMGSKRIEKLREAVKHVLFATKENDMIGIIRFASKIVFELPYNSDREYYRNYFQINEHKGGNHGEGTAMYDAIEFAISNFDTIPDNFKKVIILFSDGGDNQSKIKIDSIMRLTRQKKIEVHSIAYGYAGKNIEDLARYSGGRYYQIISTREFPFVFRDIYTILNNYYEITYKPDECYDKHFVCAELTFPFLKNVTIQAKGVYDKSAFSELDPVGTIYFVNIEFDLGKSDIKPESKKSIALIAESMRNNPKLKIKINGHTDDIGNDDFNQKLSIDRAVSVMNELIETGIDKNRLSYAGYGKSRPLVPNDGDENRRRNRRTEFEIIEK
ncbi:MAG: OmpA family protein [Candidatus Kapabacteria bacterium]|nr:OmpA family protein [Ignavibacteriota bacterium]MCW5883539.1 OmpA family protein [Candidatus Kapabacteria bacterium]